jgi:FixJ family two-component response regulator
MPVPVICITAFPTAAVCERANVDGAAGFFAKPVDDERLLGLIDELLDADTRR